MQFKDLYKLYRFAPPIAVDPPLPIDDLSRECSLNDDAYYDAEHYFFCGQRKWFDFVLGSSTTTEHI